MKKYLRNAFRDQIWQGALKRYKLEKPIVIAITGSVAKTSTKEAVLSVLSSTGREIFATPGNMNTEIGVPLSLLGFKHPPENWWGYLVAIFKSFFPPILSASKRQLAPYYVLEYSADAPGDIAYLASRIPPDLVIITKISPVHMQAYTGLEQLVEEKMSLLKFLKPHGTAFLNLDDPNQVQMVPENLSQILWYGTKRTDALKSGVWGRELKHNEKGIVATLDFVVARRIDTIGGKQRQQLALQTNILGEHQFAAVLIAAAIGYHQQIPIPKLKRALESYQVPAGRGRLIKGRKNILIVDDSYNASPESVKAGLNMLRPIAKSDLRNTKDPRRVVAILGNMNELGDYTQAAHFEIGEIAALNVDYLVAVGPNADQILKGAVKNGLNRQSMIAFATPENLLDKLDQVVQSRDLLYVKGSQNQVRLERVVKVLMANPAQAKQLLVRQEGKWNKS